jgi:hypothetical protein
VRILRAGGERGGCLGAGRPQSVESVQSPSAQPAMRQPPGTAVVAASVALER